MSNGTENPKKAVKKFLEEQNIRHYRQEELKKAILKFIKEYRVDYEDVIQGKKKATTVSSLYRKKSEVILEEYFKNSNGNREAVSAYLETIIRNRGG